MHSGGGGEGRLLCFGDRKPAFATVRRRRATVGSLLGLQWFLPTRIKQPDRQAPTTAGPHRQNPDGRASSLWRGVHSPRVPRSQADKCAHESTAAAGRAATAPAPPARTTTRHGQPRRRADAPTHGRFRSRILEAPHPGRKRRRHRQDKPVYAWLDAFHPPPADRHCSRAAVPARRDGQWGCVQYTARAASPAPQRVRNKGASLRHSAGPKMRTAIRTHRETAGRGRAAQRAESIGGLDESIDLPAMALWEDARARAGGGAKEGRARTGLKAWWIVRTV